LASKTCGILSLPVLLDLISVKIPAAQELFVVFAILEKYERFNA